MVVDKEASPRDRNWGVTIAWSHPLLAKLLPEGLYKRLSECQPDPGLDTKEAGFESVMIRDGQTGATIVEPPFPGVRRLNIQKTRRIWSEGLNVKVSMKCLEILSTHAVQYDKTVIDIELTSTGVTAHFHDGTSEPGSVLVGSDGGGSWVRWWMLGDQATPRVLPYTFLNFPFRYTREQAIKMDKMMHPIVDVAPHPKSMYVGIFVLDKPNLQKPETWVFYILATWAKQDSDYIEGKNMVEELKKRMDDWADPYKSAIEWIPDDTQAKAVQLRIWGPSETGWDNRAGRVTLSGDAAHSMTFRKCHRLFSSCRYWLTRKPLDRGQGANNAICDSEKFVSAMIKVKNGEKTLQEAVDEYDADVISRGRTEVEVSRVQTDAFHDHAKFLESPVVKHGIKPMSDIKK